MLLVVELNGSTMVARVGVMRALNRGYVPEFNSSRKDTHWERQKLRGIGNPLGYVHRRQWFGRSRQEMRVPPHCRREHHKCNNYNCETTHALT
jgi:hypothetical protein